MKAMKRAFSLLLALAMVLSLSITAFAAEGDFVNTEGSITITNAQEGATYEMYRIFDLASFNDDNPANPASGNYVYKLRQSNSELEGEEKTADAAKVAAWEAFTMSDDIRGKYITVDTNDGYVSWITGTNQAEFAKLALAYAKEHNIAPDYTANAEEKDGAYVAKQEDMRLGYYLIDSTTGALCNLTTTNPSVTIEDKNKEPVIDKLVQEDANGSWGGKNDADMNQVVNFKTFITVQTGAENYVLHDIMDDGLELVPGSIKLWSDDKATQAVDEANYTVNESPAAHVINGEAEATACTFELSIKNEYLATLEERTILAVTYQAKLTGEAVSGEAELNKTVLKYGDGGWTEYDQTETYTWDFSVFKYGNGGIPLADAHFILQGVDKGYAVFEIIDTVKAVGEDGAETDVVAKDDDEIYQKADQVKTLRFVKWTENVEEATALITPASGKFRLIGLDSNVYDLIETQAPHGYEKLTSPVRIVINNTGAVTHNGNQVADKVVPVANTAGGILPSTGGSGTTMLYVIGAILTLGAAVLLVTKRRMAIQ